jgi:hypothetical protein
MERGSAPAATAVGGQARSAGTRSGRNQVDGSSWGRPPALQRSLGEHHTDPQLPPPREPRAPRTGMVRNPKGRPAWVLLPRQAGRRATSTPRGESRGGSCKIFPRAPETFKCRSGAAGVPFRWRRRRGRGGWFMGGKFFRNSCPVILPDFDLLERGAFSHHPASPRGQERRRRPTQPPRPPCAAPGKDPRSIRNAGGTP